MNTPALTSSSANTRLAELPDETSQKIPWASPSAWASLLAGFFTAFTLSIGGEMPAGEIILLVVAGWSVLCLIFNHAWPGSLLKNRFLLGLLLAQLVAFGAYIFSDLYRHSLPHDMLRGWSRMLFLAVDLLAIAYLFSRAPRNFIIFLAGQYLGDLVSAAISGPLFGDVWKFGVGGPLTILLFFIAPFAGPFAAILAAGAIGLLHFVLDYRSLGGLCLVAGILNFLQILSRGYRWWLAPLGVLAAVASIVWTYGYTQNSGRSTRSDIERSAMVTAAIEAVKESPVVGHGSWFSNSNVYDNFVLIRQQAAKEAHVGGFASLNANAENPEVMALHSQILVALAEGGIFGGAFFFVYGAGLLWALYKIVLAGKWHRLTPLCTLLLLLALWNLFCSPFSGAHRVYIAIACGLMLLLREGRLFSEEHLRS